MAYFRKIYLDFYIWLIDRHLLAVVTTTASGVILGVVWIFVLIVMRGYRHG